MAIVCNLLGEQSFAQFPDAHELPPSGWAGPVFELSQDYPTVLPSPEDYPWNDIDYSLQVAFGILNQKQSRNADFAALANALEQSRVTKSIAASSAYVQKLEETKQQFDQPMMIDGEMYYPVSRGD